MAARSGARRVENLHLAASRRHWMIGMGVFVTLLVASAYAGYLHLSQPGRLPLRVVEINGEFNKVTLVLFHFDYQPRAFCCSRNSSLMPLMAITCTFTVHTPLRRL